MALALFYFIFSALYDAALGTWAYHCLLAELREVGR
jgi:hypothetical protein